MSKPTKKGFLPVEELIKISKEEIAGETELTVSGRELHAYLEVVTPFTKWVQRRVEETQLIEGQDFRVLDNSVQNWTGRPAYDYSLTLDSAKHIAMMERTAKSKLIRQYFIEVEKAARRTSLTLEQMLNDPRTAAAVFTRLAETQEELAKEKALKGEAIRTKAQISDKKTATAMATASVYARKVDALSKELGCYSEFATIVKVEQALKRKFHYRPLVNYCNLNGVEPLKVDGHAVYGKVNAYPATAWMAVYKVDLRELFSRRG